MDQSVICIGGGPASFFAAIHAKMTNPKRDVSILEGSGRLLTKVRISGGGRCNVTHHLFDLKAFAQCYPRGSREILGPLHHFGPEDTIDWFQKRGVTLVPEPDGRMFPTTNTSQTIIECLHHEARTLGVRIEKGALVKSIERLDTGGFKLQLRDKVLECNSLFLGTGSMPTGHQLAKSLGHRITDLAPSLFTFCVSHPLLEDLAGISFPNAHLSLKIGKKTYKRAGPLLITHWGLSGPAVLKLSAFAARDLLSADYRGDLTIDFLADRSRDDLQESISSLAAMHRKKLMANAGLAEVPTRFWKRLVEQVAPGETWASAHHRTIQDTLQSLKSCAFQVNGKGVFKDEFVTCGGISLKEVNFKTMESKLVPGLFFGGEVLDIDGITGGFNFQNAWTSGYLAGTNM